MRFLLTLSILTVFTFFGYASTESVDQLEGPALTQSLAELEADIFSKLVEVSDFGPCTGRFYHGYYYWECGCIVHVYQNTGYPLYIGNFVTCGGDDEDGDIKGIETLDPIDLGDLNQLSNPPVNEYGGLPGTLQTVPVQNSI